ncbi:MAG TPA: hypothetical protein VI504_04265 [Candidatus Eisenbacteria bacterium]
MPRTRTARLVIVALAACAAGCGGAPAPQSAPPPPADSAPDRSLSNAVSTAADSVGAVPGSADAAFVYRFRQTEPGASGTFSFRDRDLSFSFRPSPNVLYFGVENLQGRPVQIDWDRSTFLDPNGRTGKVGHQTTRWRNRFSTQALTQVLPRQRYSDYVFALDDLLDPGADADTQLRRPLLPEDSSAPTFAGKTFGVDLVFLVENQPRTYTFRFQVQSVIPR